MLSSHRRHHLGGLRLLAGLLAFIMCNLPGVGATADINAVRFGLFEGMTRVVIDGDAALRYATVNLPDPPRLAVTLPGFDWQNSTRFGRPRGAVRAFTISRDQNGHAVLLLRLRDSDHVLVRDFLMAPRGDFGHRVVLDFKRDPSAPALLPVRSPPSLTPKRKPAPPALLAAAELAPRVRPASMPVRAASTAVSPHSEANLASAATRSADDATALSASDTAFADLDDVWAALAEQNDAAAPAPSAPLATQKGDDPAPALGPRTSIVSAPPAQGNDQAVAADEDVTLVAQGVFGALPSRSALREAEEPPSVTPELGLDAATDANPEAADEMTGLGPRKPVVVIDPGHGGKDPGAISRSGLLERDLVYTMAERLAETLQASERYEVVLTRRREEGVRLSERVRRAKRADGDVFLSLHADSLPDSPEVRGASVYTLSERASDAEAARLARAENAADRFINDEFSRYDEDIQSYIVDVLLRDSTQRADELADFVVAELGPVARLVGKPKRSAGFVVLRQPAMPSLLIELGYLSSPIDEVRLRDPERQRDLASAIMRALDRASEVDLFFLDDDN